MRYNAHSIARLKISSIREWDADKVLRLMNEYNIIEKSVITVAHTQDDVYLYYWIPTNDERAKLL